MAQQSDEAPHVEHRKSYTDDSGEGHRHAQEDHRPENANQSPEHRGHGDESTHTDGNRGHDHGRGGGHSGHDMSGHEEMFRRRFWVSLVLTIPVLLFSPFIQDIFGFTMPEFPGSQFVGAAFSFVIFFYGGLPFLQMAVPELRHRRPGMMTLISLAITVAFVYSVFSLFLPDAEAFFWEMATLIVIMLLGHWIEMRSIRQASGALEELAQLIPDTAELIRSEEGGRRETEEVPVDTLKKGDVVLVRPGASVPVDGEVVGGESTVNQAMITGESEPVPKESGDEVIGGTINGSGSLRVRVTATGDETALAGIMRLVDEAQQSKSETQVLADRAAGWLFYVALGVGLITAVAWTLAVGLQLAVLERTVTVLVIACPHALGLAIPLVVAISTALGARNGILVRDRLALEEARELDVVVFDKTGTLTEGRFGVAEMAVVEAWDEEEALALAAAVEADSEHPIAEAIRSEARRRDLDTPALEGFEAIKGRGIRAEHNGGTVYVGGPRLLEQLELDAPEELGDFTAGAGKKGHTVVYLISEDAVTAGFALADVIRPESYEAVKALRAHGLEVAMLTGDSEEVAQAVAGELGIDTYFAEVLPEHKDEKIRALQEQGKRVVMVGDGVNDAPALVRADVGIAIGSGTDVAIESAGIILVQNNPLDVVRVFELSKATYRKMIQNLIWATGYNVVALPLAAGVLAPIGILLSPAVGALLMSLSTVVVAINANLLRGMDL